MHTTILAATVLLQFSAAAIALQISRATGNRLSWRLISLAMFLTAGSSSMTLFVVVAADVTRPPDLTADIAALVITGLGVAGFARMRPSVESVSEDERLFALSLDLMCVATLNGTFVRVNAAFESLLGWSASELECHSFLDFVHPDDRESTLRELERLEQKGDGVEFVNRYRCRNGRYRLLSWSCPALEPGDARLFATARDVTERRQLEDSLRNTNAELESFSYSVSHDLRAPLRHIDGFSSALLEDYGDRIDDSGREMIGFVREATEKMNTRIDDLLRLSRVTRRDMNATVVDLSAEVHAIEAELRRLDSQRSVEFRIEDGIQRLGDPNLIRIVLYNLLHNAWKYSGKKSHAVIEFGQCPGSEASRELFVRDNGIGFNSAYADKLFAPFQRLHRQTDFPGSGVGLATVHRAIARHGGKVRAESPDDSGATFYFTLGDSVEQWEHQVRVTPAPPDKTT